MNVYLPFLAIIPLLAAVLFTEADPSATHVDERPPNAPAYVYQQAVILPAPFPEERAPEPTITLRTSQTNSEPTATPMPTPTIPVYAQPKLTPAIDGVCGYDRTLKALNEEQMRAVLTEAGWPLEWQEQALRVTWGESNWCPEITNGIMLGLFQLSDRSGSWPGWWEHFGFDPTNYADPVYNARLAWLVMQYDLARGVPWAQWEVKP